MPKNKLRLEVEQERNRLPNLGYEQPSDSEFIRCLAHGFPTPLARWHCHDEYELHFITATHGRAFIGDWVGTFGPGQLILTGPRVPHNWISEDIGDSVVEERDLVIQFSGAPLTEGIKHIPELFTLKPMLELSQYGIEFFGINNAREYWRRVKESHGIARFAAFCTFLDILARCRNYRLLSSVPANRIDNYAQLKQINAIANRVKARLHEPLLAADLAQEWGMSNSRFSRLFQETTGNTFSEFVNRLRIAEACQLLIQSDRYISEVAYAVGFNNLANFNRRFLEHKGMTPSEYRRQHEILLH